MRLVYLVCGASAGVLLAATLSENSLLVWFLALVTAFLITLLTQRWSVRQVLVWAVFGFALGGLRFSLLPPPADISRYNQMGGMTIEGIVVAEPDFRDDRIDLRVQAETVTRIGQTLATSGQVLVQIPRDQPVHYGDRVRVTGDLVRPPQFDAFSYADYLGRSGIYSILRDASIEVVDMGQGIPLLSSIFRLKDIARINIARSLPEPAAGLLTGILLGDSRNLSPEVTDAFNRVGASHIIAISGFNMAVVSGVVMRLLSRMRAPRRLALVIGIVTVLLYTVLVGAGPAVLRAAFMSSMLVIGTALKRRTFIPASLAFVTIVLIFLNPAALWDIGFQLSLFATVGIALLSNPISRWLEQVLARLFSRQTAVYAGDLLVEPLAVTLAAQITTLPLIMLTFERLSLVALVVNMLVIPVQSYLLLLGLLALLVSLIIPALSTLFFWIDLVFLGWTIGVVRTFASLSFAEVSIRVDSRLVALFYVALIGGGVMNAVQPDFFRTLALLIRRRLVLLGTTLCALVILVLMFSVVLSRPDGLLHVWFLDVGHSNGVLIQTPGGAQLLVDGGRYPSRLLNAVGDRLPFNDRVIETLLITQPDVFDYGALPELLDRYGVGAVLVHGQPNLEPAYVRLMDRLADRVVTVQAGYRLETSDGVLVEILHPAMQPEIADDLDTGVLIARVTYQGVSFLLAGDLNQEGQTALLAGGQWPLATVLQLPKHAGIRSLDDTFLAAVQPSAAVVQIDPANRLGDPDADVLLMLGETPVYRTDQMGTVHFFTDGTTLSVVGDRRMEMRPE